MQEIEVKFRVLNSTYSDVVAKIEHEYTVDLLEKRQDDLVYLLPEQINKPITAGSKIMRIRQVESIKEGKQLLTLKVQTEQALVSDEYEFEIGSVEAAKDMLVALGWLEDVDVVKKRSEGEVGGYGICIDEVKVLGLFIELEKLAKDNSRESIEIIQNEMKEFLGNLGLSGDISMIPYDTQLKSLRDNEK